MYSSLTSLLCVYTAFLAGTNKTEQVRFKCEKHAEIQQVIDGARAGIKPARP